ncbi:hypothetical protein D9M73_143370 [compost metagenome]
MITPAMAGAAVVGAMMAPSAKMAWIRPCRLCSKRPNSQLWPPTMIAAPDNPCSTRQMTRRPRLGASEHPAEPTMRRMIAQLSKRRVPSQVSNSAVIGKPQTLAMKYARFSQVASSGAAETEPAMCPPAMSKIVAFKPSMTAATVSAPTAITVCARVAPPGLAEAVATPGG